MSLKNFLSVSLLTFLLISFLAIPQSVSAIEINFFNFQGGDTYEKISESESKRILEIFPKAINNKWTNVVVDAYIDNKEKTVLSLLREVTRFNLWNYYFRDLPLDVSFAVAKQAVEISRLVVSEDVSGILEKVEKETAKMAVSHLKEYFFKNQVKASFGAMEVKYKTGAGDVNSPFQYIIMYAPNDGRVVARIYSPKEIAPPASRGSLGMIKGFLNSMEAGQNIPPFIVEISGEMEKGAYGSYRWKNVPEIRTVFPENVPDFGLKPKTWQEKYITDPIKRGMEDILSLAQFLGFQTEAVDYIFKEGDSDKIDEEIGDMREEGDVAERYPEEREESEKLQTVAEKETESEIKKREEKKEEEPAPAICSRADSSADRRYLIFNEIAWMGSKNNASDEWIELKNISGSDISLKGWQLVDDEEQIKVVFGDVSIPAGGLYLLERTDDESVPFKTADLIYKGSLSNKEEELYLFDQSCGMQDFVLAEPDWPAGEGPERRTMERADDLSWHTYSGAGAYDIFGTPKGENSRKEEKGEVKKEDDSSATPPVYFSGGGGSATVEPIYCSQSGLSSPTGEVIINEVAWMGTEYGSSDEWIELKNISEGNVILNGWQLLDKNNQIKVIFSSDVSIPAGGLYLLERTDDESVPNIEADRIYSGALSDTQESLRLFDSGCRLVDEVLAEPDWPAGDKDAKVTMERNGGWHSYSLGQPDETSGLMGTPKRENSPSPTEPDEEEEKEEEDDEENLSGGESPLLITEVNVDGENGAEYVELFNRGEEDIELCPDEQSCCHLSYYSRNSVWADPFRNWKFPEEAVIPVSSYYIIGVYGEIEADWRIETAEETEEEHYYESGQLNNSTGSLSLFYGNPRYAGEEEMGEEDREARAISLKADAVSWTGGEDVIVGEGNPFVIERGKVIGRRWIEGEYIDTDDNLNDFRAEDPSPRDHAPRPPSPVEDLSLDINPDRRNSAALSWTVPEDEDTLSEDLDFEIYYSRNSEIDEENLLKMEDYVLFEIEDVEESSKRAVIPDLYYSSEYSFAVRARDPENNYSEISNKVSFSIEEAVHQKAAPYGDFMRSGRVGFPGPRTEDILETEVFSVDGNGNANDDNPASASVIGESGVAYFSVTADNVHEILAYDSGIKWSYSDGTEVFGNPSLGRDGSVYFSSDNNVYALSPSGRLEWRREFAKVYTDDIAIDSQERIYFIAAETSDNATLFSLDGETLSPLYTVGSLTDVNISELVIDLGDNVFFSKGNTVFKFRFGGGKLSEMEFSVMYEKDYSGEEDKTDLAEQPHVTSDGDVLVNVSRGCCYSNNAQADVLYLLDNDLNEIKWYKKEYGPVIGMGDGEAYVSIKRRDFYESMAVDLSDGSVKWAKGRFYPQSSLIVSDSNGNIYFRQGNIIRGYDPEEITSGDEADDRIFSLSWPESYCYSPPTIGSGAMYIPRFSDILVLRY